MQPPDDLNPQTYYSVSSFFHNTDTRKDLTVHATIRAALADFADRATYFSAVISVSDQYPTRLIQAGDDHRVLAVVELSGYVGVWTNANPALDYGYCVQVRKQGEGRVVLLPELRYAYQVGRWVSDLGTVVRDMGLPLIDVTTGGNR